MLGFSRKTRGQLMRDELGSSWEHFLQAASHAANGVGSTVGPRASAVRGAAERGWGSTAAALAPLAVAYRQGAADARAEALKLAKKTTKATRKGKQQMSNKKVGMLIGLLAAGAAVGAAGALVMRRRRRQQWADYDPTESFDSMSPDARAMVDKASSRADKAMSKAADKLDSTASSMRKSDFKAKAENASEAMGDATDDMNSKFSSAKHNSRP